MKTPSKIDGEWIRKINEKIYNILTTTPVRNGNNQTLRSADGQNPSSGRGNKRTRS